MYSSAAVKDFVATTNAINGDRATTCANYQSWICDAIYPDTDRLANPGYVNTQEETTTAAYALVNYGFDDLAMPIDGNVGVRIVQTDSLAVGSLVVNELAALGIPSSTEEFEARTNKTHVLPSFNLRLQATDDLYLRFAASKAIWAPSFRDKQARITLANSVKDGVTTATSINDYKFTLTQDTNPYLEPMTANQFDLSAEWYFDDNGGMAHFAVFKKDVKGFFRRGATPFSFDAAGATVGGEATWLANIGSGEINGAEIGVSKFFDSLPAPFDGLGLQANYTYIDSKANIPLINQPVGGDTHAGAAPLDTDRSIYGQMPVDQLSKNAFNIIGMYEKDGFSARLAYSWRSKYLITWGGNGFDPDFNDGAGGKARLPVYNDDYGQLDASVSYTFLDNYTVTAEASNLLQEKTVGIVDQNAAGDHVAYSYAQDARFAVGIRAKF